MSKFEENVEKRLIWLTRFKVFTIFFRWLAKDPKNATKFLVWFNSFNSLLYFTAMISPWIYPIWILLVPFALFRTNPITSMVVFIQQTRNGQHSFTNFSITIFFILIHYACFFACIYMICGVIVDANGEPISGIWSNFYFSVVTFTTLGYGNLVPANFAGEVFATIEAIVGYAVFALLIGIGSALALHRGHSSE